MKKLLLVSALLAGSLALADQKKYEISPMIGYDFAEGNLNVNRDSYPVGGLELQFNTPDSKISPEFSVLYSQGVDYKTNLNANTEVIRSAFNGVYTFDAMGAMVPFVKLGAGLEKITQPSYSVDDGFFLDTGAGAKIPFTENIALKLEAIYMAKIGTNNAGFADSNLVTMAGITFAFGGQEAKVAPKPVVIEKVIKKEPVKVAPVVAPVVIDGDDDRDGVLNSVDICPNTLQGIQVDTKGCNADLDNDGVLNENDICPNTLAGIQVDTKGCNADLDNDGVLNENDICPNTPAGDTVNSDGCPKNIALKVNFKYKSNNIQRESEPQIQQYADFLNEHRNYHAKIIGYTDSRGSAAYNRKLSQKRAYAVATDLISKGVDTKQISSFGAGESNPIADNATEEGRAQNRRIEVELTKN